MLTLNFFYHYLFAKRAGSLIKTISRISVLGIAIGMAALIIVMSVMTGFNTSIKETILLTKPHLIVAGHASENTSSLIRSQDPKVNMYNIEKQDVVVRTLDGLFSGAVAKGYEPAPLRELFARLEKKQVGENWPLMDLQEAAELEKGEAILGLGLARSLNVLEGDELVVIPPESLLSPSGEVPIYAKVKVKAIIQTQLQDIDDQVLYYGLGKGMQSLSQSSSIERETEIRLSDVNLLGGLAESLRKQNIKFETWEDRDSALLFALKMEKLMIALFIGLATFITSFSIITVLVLLITQKRGDIGILMAMGLSQTATRRLFTKMGFMLSMLGLGSGFAIGISVSLFLSTTSLDILPNIYRDTSVPVNIDFNLLLGAAIGGFIVSIMGSILPVYFSLRYTPVQAIRGAR